MQLSPQKMYVCCMLVFVSILFGTSNSIGLNLMLPKLKFNVLPNDHKWLWHSQRLLKNQESVAIGGFINIK